MAILVIPICKGRSYEKFEHENYSSLVITITSFSSLLAQSKSDQTANILKQDAFKTFDSNEMIGKWPDRCSERQGL